ncbi:Multisite-specific tRNA:(cytosine-C(5))-methyltransferase [Elsinoe australis]|uniref:Multisite-specific tRNA:(Cytosine-C(5))-methyltransferase n=1 Tax=Elsinoe australis TaxID=40998 RepID=A0A2P8A2T1_9PEZI|nr:Multisite-specific tRNA:(cytosine-C(5))-methyltransferase [Elsinoe australis]
MASAAVTNGSSQPSITYYNNRRCPWAHRASIALKELNLPFEEVTIDLDTPRPQWYLDINPRGLVPTIKYTGGAIKDEIIPESAVVAQFLADNHPSHLTPPSKTEDGKGALFRARVNFFVDNWFSKVNSKMYPIMLAESDEKKEELVKEVIAAVEKEIEPHLKDAGPFFGGSSKLTMAEVLTAPFVIRFKTYSNGEFMPTSLSEGLEKLPNFSKWAAALRKEESVMWVYDEEGILSGTRNRLAKMKSK